MTGEISKRRPLLTSRQIGIAVSIGGLAFAWRALGLVIPLYPPIVFDMRPAFLAIGTFAGGPYVGLIIAILCAIPAGIPIVDLIGFSVWALLFSPVVKKIWALKGIKRHALLWFTVFLLEYFWVWPYLIGVLSFVFGFFPFWPMMMIAWFGGGALADTILISLAVSLAIEYAPDFMRPTWSWKGGEEYVEEG